MHQTFGYLPLENGGHEPALFLCNAGRTVAIGLSVAHRFVNDAEAIEKCTAYAAHLYGYATKSEVYRLIQLVTNSIRTLIATPPPPHDFQGGLPHGR